MGKRVSLGQKSVGTSRHAEGNVMDQQPHNEAIQPRIDSVTSANRRPEVAEFGQDIEDASSPPPRPNPSAFAIIVGLLAGPTSGAACAWLADLVEGIWLAIAIGGFLGPITAALIAAAERRVRGEFTRPDVATM